MKKRDCINALNFAHAAASISATANALLISPDSDVRSTAKNMLALAGELIEIARRGMAPVAAMHPSVRDSAFGVARDEPCLQEGAGEISAEQSARNALMALKLAEALEKQ